MTMLDRMRRHRNWLKWSLALVVLTFVVFYIPAFLGDPGSTLDTVNTIAEVEGQPISVVEFNRAYNAQVQAYRNAYGANFNEALLRQLGLDRQILQQLIDERAALVEAERLGITATDAEVRERILKFPAFQENGQFIGEQRYRQLLQMQRPPLTPDEFEGSVRRSIVLDKLRTAVTGWITVSDAEVDQEFRRLNEKVKVQVVPFRASAFADGVQVSDQELAQYFEGHKDAYRIAERRKIRYTLIDPQKLRERVNVGPQDVERYYNANIQQFSTPEQVRASHILLKTEGKDEATVRKQAEDVLAKVRAGGDFAALATQFSEDEASKVKGGDLDFFPQGRMVPEFDAVAFSMQPGVVSDLVKTQYGFHIIKVTDKRAAQQRPIEEVRDQVTEQLKWERAQDQAKSLASRLDAQIAKASDLDSIAKANGLTVADAGPFLRDEPIPGVGPSAQASQQAFTLKEGEVSPAVQVGQGYMIFTVTGIEAPKMPTLDEVKDKVRDAVVKQKSLEIASARARDALATLKSAPDFEAAAKAAGLEVMASNDFQSRGMALPGIGVNARADQTVFALQPGAVSDPVPTDDAVAIVRLVERQDVTPTQVEAGRAQLREQLLNDRRGRFFSSYMGKAREKMKVDINQEAVQRLSA
jgi:peptidyl-prolyl cis-trans isomerase D